MVALIIFLLLLICAIILIKYLLDQFPGLPQPIKLVVLILAALLLIVGFYHSGYYHLRL